MPDAHTWGVAEYYDCGTCGIFFQVCVCPVSLCAVVSAGLYGLWVIFLHSWCSNVSENQSRHGLDVTLKIQNFNRKLGKYGEVKKNSGSGFAHVCGSHDFE